MRSMFSFLHRNRTAPDEPVSTETAAAQRAAEFWRRWDELLPETAAALGDGELHRVENLLADAVAELHPELTFTVERGETAVYALVVTGQADPDLRVWTDAWKAVAPPADSLWEYHDAVPPVPDPNEVTVNLRGEKYPLSQIRVAAQVDEAEGLVDVAVHHPGYADLDENARRALTFLPLDAALGERLAADRLGRVETAVREPQGAIDLLQLRDLVRELAGAADGD